MFARFGLFVRNLRRDEESGFVDEEIEIQKRGETKAYPYLLVMKALFYAFIGSAIVSLFFIFFILEPDHHDLPEVFVSDSKSFEATNSNHTTHMSLTSTALEVVDQCSQEWTTDQLVGRCFGLKPHSDFVKDLHSVESSQHCRALCCRLGEQCKTWQYWTENKICKLGDLVRIGTENLDTPNWCDSEPPVVWSGRRVETKNGVNIETGAILSTQCFGMGPAKKVDGQETLSMEDCSAACLQMSDCKIWQWHEKRGCYYSSNPQVYCDPYTGSFEGGRKKNQN